MRAQDHITGVTLRDLPKGWELTWTSRSGYHSRFLYGVDTTEEAINDALDYFGGLITREDICITDHGDYDYDSETDL